jgi:hypothetical protein
VPAAALASQIFSFTSAIRSLIAANSACRATSDPGSQATIHKNMI